MNKEYKEKWVKALRSGHYAQGMGAMKRRPYGSGENLYCCLGVLQEINDRMIDETLKNGHPYYKSVTGSNGILTEADYEFYGIDKDEIGSIVRLIVMNDDLVQFDIIADFIERYL